MCYKILGSEPVSIGWTEVDLSNNSSFHRDGSYIMRNLTGRKVLKGRKCRLDLRGLDIQKTSLSL